MKSTPGKIWKTKVSFDSTMDENLFFVKLSKDENITSGDTYFYCTGGNSVPSQWSHEVKAQTKNSENPYISSFQENHQELPSKAAVLVMQLVSFMTCHGQCNIQDKRVSFL